MTFWLALMLGTAAPVTPALQHEAAGTSTQSLDARADHIADLVVAKQMAEAAALIDPLLADYEKANAAEKRHIYCAADATESRRYMAEVRAEKPARPAVTIGKGWCVALWAKGYVLNDAGKSAEAIPYLLRAVDMRPGQRQYWAELAFAYQVNKAWPEMLDASRRAAILAAEIDEPDRATFLCKAWHSMAYAQIELRSWDDAIELLNKCLALDPDNAKAKGELEYIARSRPKG
jgi:tetratricopeptide (TPR) repeat protein